MSTATDLKVRDHGDRALLLECTSVHEVLAWTSALNADPIEGVTDIVPASRTVLLKLNGPADQPMVRHRLTQRTAPPGSLDNTTSPPVTIPVRYDGLDLEEVAEHTGLGVDGVITAHTGRVWTVGFCGFAPGFAYLVGGDPRLAIPRRADPRTKVPAGSVALAGEFSGIYPRESPGGWQLIGTTDTVIWDLDRNPPALLTPGARVQFREVTA
ncbi:5-oxoprolinase subunit B family protein [Mycobacteroides abscessus]|uniref:5-oxoprolinase subunit B family protein n=1 Tax=Mycobacteroides abscessus TaxID=36809 RepID=UPI000C25DA13|nr:allophanate hydrolase subunit 1 [Mycobacteroides abscessus]MBE5462292.1 KipI family sensor histidine kinase inhibitor [Mycobacteroides abscessus]QOF45244.1 KipI family sensor histidine kinase inhibitor [Mycobacteroides abscessus]QOF49943.1 KipI family sensor histidine kinase inhibitor [Mycobacteroides abscessus]